MPLQNAIGLWTNSSLDAFPANRKLTPKSPFFGPVYAGYFWTKPENSLHFSRLLARKSKTEQGINSPYQGICFLVRLCLAKTPTDSNVV